MQRLVQEALQKGVQLYQQGLLAEAETLCRKIFETAPGHPDANHLLGLIERQAGRSEQAVERFSMAIQENPDVAAYHGNLGNAFRDLGRLDEAVASYRKALAIQPDYVEAQINLGGALKELGRLDEALASHRRAVEIAPGSAEAHHHLSLQLLLLGEMREGWDEYEWRWRSKYGVLPRDFPHTPWQGEDPAGKTVLVWSEQGVGDEILFAGMIPTLTDAGARVIMECDPRLVDVFARSFPGVTCIARTARPDARLLEPGIDYQSAAGSLGRWLRLNTDPSTAPAAYLSADGAGARRYQRTLQGGRRRASPRRFLEQQKQAHRRPEIPAAGGAGSAGRPSGGPIGRPAIRRHPGRAGCLRR